MTDCENSSDGEEFLDDCLDITRLKEFMSAYEIERLHYHIENKTQKTIEYLEISKEEDQGYLFSHINNKEIENIYMRKYNDWVLFQQRSKLKPDVFLNELIQHLTDEKLERQIRREFMSVKNQIRKGKNIYELI